MWRMALGMASATISITADFISFLSTSGKLSP
jgi:hypothetical protein